MRNVLKKPSSRWMRAQELQRAREKKMFERKKDPISPELRKEMPGGAGK